MLQAGGQSNNDSHTSLQCAMMYDCRYLSHSGCMYYVHLCGSADVSLIICSHGASGQANQSVS